MGLRYIIESMRDFCFALEKTDLLIEDLHSKIERYESVLSATKEIAAKRDDLDILKDYPNKK